MDSQRPDDESGPAAGRDRPGRPDRDRTHSDADLPPLPPEWADLVIPDDASALAAEAAEVRAELRAQRRQRRIDRFSRVFRTRRWERYGMSGPLMILVLVVVSSFASLLITVLPTAPKPPQPGPLARTSAPAGSVGGLMPDVVLRRSDGSVLAVRGIRPAVVLLIADACDCRSLIDSYVAATAEARVGLLVIGERRRPAVPELAMSRVVGLTDPAATLAGALKTRSRPPNPTSVLVRDSGVITRIAVNAGDVAALRDEITALVPG